MKDSFCLDGSHTDQKPHVCGVTIFGSDTGRCPGCNTYQNLMLSGYCANCARTKGMSLFCARTDISADPDSSTKE